MGKLEMAHEYAKIMLDSMLNKNVDLDSYREVASDAWSLADAMQAEADKRNHIVEPNEKVEEWQPDWSQAPDRATHCAMDENNMMWWHAIEPKQKNNEWLGDMICEYEDHDYQGDWRKSLRKRPE